MLKIFYNARKIFYLQYGVESYNAKGLGAEAWGEGELESYNANFLGGSMGGRKIEIYNAKFLGGSIREDKLRFIMLNFWVEAWGGRKVENLYC